MPHKRIYPFQTPRTTPTSGNFLGIFTPVSNPGNTVNFFFDLYTVHWQVDKNCTICLIGLENMCVHLFDTKADYKGKYALENQNCDL